MKGEKGRPIYTLWKKGVRRRGRVNGYVQFYAGMEYIKVVIDEQVVASLDKKTARLLAKRITECLGDAEKRGEGRKRSNSKEV